MLCFSDQHQSFEPALGTAAPVTKYLPLVSTGEPVFGHGLYLTPVSRLHHEMVGAFKHLLCPSFCPPYQVSLVDSEFILSWVKKLYIKSLRN